MSSKKITNIALLTAVVVLLQSLSTLGLFTTRNGVSFAFGFVPIMIGVVCLGLWTGVFLGFAFSSVVLIFALCGMDALTLALIQAKPVLTIFLIYLKGCLAPAVSYFVYKALSKKSVRWGVYLACPICPIINTAVFCFMMLLFYRSTLSSTPGFSGDGVMKIVFITLAGVNFVVEFIINLIFAPVIYRLKGLYDKLFA